MLLYISVGMFLFLVVPSVLAILLALSHGMILRLRLLLLLFTAVALFLPGRLIWVTVRRKWKTGSIFPSDQERLTNLAKAAAQSASPRWRAGHTVLYSFLGIFWIAIAAFSVTRGLHDHPQPNWFLVCVMPLLAILGLVTVGQSLRRINSN